MGYSIKFIADTVGVSKPAIMKRIDELNLRDKLIKKGNRLIVPEEEYNQLLKSFEERKRANTGTRVPENMTEKVPENNAIDKALEILQAELKEKDQQIDRLMTQIEQLQRDNANTVLALQQANTLHAGTMKSLSENNEEKPGIMRKFFRR